MHLWSDKNGGRQVFMWQTMWVVFVVSFLMTVALMIALRPVASVIGLVDRPNGRKQHRGEIPLTGGIAMTIGMLTGTLFMPQLPEGFAYVAAGVCLLTIVGALDDRFDAPKIWRLAAQALAALLLVDGTDLRVFDLGPAFLGNMVELGELSVIFTVLAVVTGINAFNVFDGSNGIAGGQALIALALMGCLAADSQMLVIIVALWACVAGFLVFNWPSRATRRLAFMGDAGSTVLGFCLAWLSIELSQGQDKAFAPVCVLWIFALPIYDLLSSIVRRIAAGRSPLAADNGHLHHLLYRYFGNCAAVAYVIVAAAALLGCLGVYGHSSGVSDGVLFAGWLALGALYHLVFATRLIFSATAATANVGDLGSRSADFIETVETVVRSAQH
jgi:UDP-GlcNAc:undecaprenyl-phosphate/decaprenyl-phosphate GlcNAc-1-phosphate transferase